MSTTNFKFNPFTNNLDLVGAGGAPGGVIETINTIPPDASDNFTIAEGTGITITPGTNSITISSTGGSGIETLEADDSTTATGSTVTISGGTTGLTTTASSATLDLTGILNGANGGTGVDNSGLTIDLGSATSGYVLTSDSSGNATWQAGGGGGGVTTVDGDSGSVTGSTITVKAGYSSQNCGSSVKFVGSGSTLTMDFSDSNQSTCLGNGCGVTPNISFYANTAIGDGALNAGSNGCNTVVAVGNAVLRSATNVERSVAIGASSMLDATSGLYNTCVGYEAASSMLTGSTNTILGSSSGSAYVGAETNNLLLGANIAGTAAESNVIRIGNSSNSKCFITGVEGVSTSNPNIVLVNTSTNQLGSTSTLSGALGGTGVDNSGLTINLGSATSGYVLTSDSSGNGTWQAGGGGGSLTIDVDGSGSVSGSTIDLYANSGSANAGSSVAFIAASGTEIDLQTSDVNQNTIIGQASGVLGTAASSNTGLGYNCLASLANSSSFNNVAVGVQALNTVDVGTDNTGIGTASLSYISGASGSYNTALGSATAENLMSGGSNTLIGYHTGNSYRTSESNNICLGANIGGTTGESNVIRIGNSSNTKCFITGVEGVSTSNPNIVLVNTSTNQLGSTSTLSGALGGTGVDNSGLTINLGSATSGYVLTSDSSGNATWQAGGGGGSLTINVDSSGSVSGSTVDLYANSGSANAGGSVAFIAASGTEIDLQLTDGSFNTQLGNGTSGTGSYNTSIGASTFGGSSGTNNVAIGYSAANGAIFTNSVIIGSNSANSEEGNSFANSTFVGYSAGWDIQGSSSNCTLIGYYAGSNYVNDESQNICISSNGVRNESNVIHIGDDSLIAATQCFIGGISGVTVTGAAVLCSSSGQLGTISSSQRYKKNIHDMDEASDVIMGLRPVTFAYKSDPNEALNYGLIAEEVEEICPNLVVYDKEGRPDSVSYHMLPAMLLNELQKQAKIIADLTERLEALEG